MSEEYSESFQAGRHSRHPGGDDCVVGLESSQQAHSDEATGQAGKRKTKDKDKGKSKKKSKPKPKQTSKFGRNVKPLPVGGIFGALIEEQSESESDDSDGDDDNEGEQQKQEPQVGSKRGRASDFEESNQKRLRAFGRVVDKKRTSELVDAFAKSGLLDELAGETSAKAAKKRGFSEDQEQGNEPAEQSREKRRKSAEEYALARTSVDSEPALETRGKAARKYEALEVQDQDKEFAQQGRDKRRKRQEEYSESEIPAREAAKHEQYVKKHRKEQEEKKREQEKQARREQAQKEQQEQRRRDARGLSPEEPEDRKRQEEKARYKAANEAAQEAIAQGKSPAEAKRVRDKVLKGKTAQPIDVAQKAAEEVIALGGSLRDAKKTYNKELEDSIAKSLETLTFFSEDTAADTASHTTVNAAADVTANTLPVVVQPPPEPIAVDPTPPTPFLGLQSSQSTAQSAQQTSYAQESEASLLESQPESITVDPPPQISNEFAANTELSHIPQLYSSSFQPSELPPALIVVDPAPQVSTGFVESSQSSSQALLQDSHLVEQQPPPEQIVVEPAQQTSYQLTESLQSSNEVALQSLQLQEDRHLLEQARPDSVVVGSLVEPHLEPVALDQTPQASNEAVETTQALNESSLESLRLEEEELQQPQDSAEQPQQVSIGELAATDFPAYSAEVDRLLEEERQRSGQSQQSTLPQTPSEDPWFPEFPTESAQYDLLFDEEFNALLESQENGVERQPISSVEDLIALSDQSLTQAEFANLTLEDDLSIPEQPKEVTAPESSIQTEECTEPLTQTTSEEHHSPHQPLEVTALQPSIQPEERVELLTQTTSEELNIQSDQRSLDQPLELTAPQPSIQPEKSFEPHAQKVRKHVHFQEDPGLFEQSAQTTAPQTPIQILDALQEENRVKLQNLHLQKPQDSIKTPKPQQNIPPDIDMASGGSLFDRIGPKDTSAPANTGAPQSTGLFGSAPATNQGTGSTLFGGATTSAPQNSNMFGSATSAPQSSGLFGSTIGNQSSTPSASPFGSATPMQNQPQTSGTPSLFGSTQNQNQATSSPSLFPQALNQQPQQNTSAGTLFGAKPQQPTIPSLFGATNTNTASPVPSSGSTTLFGGSAAPTANSQPTLGSGLFGGVPTQPQQQQTQQSALLGSSLLTNQPHAQQNQPQAATSQAEPTKGALTTTAQFHELLQRTKKRQAPFDSDGQIGDLPTLQLNLGDISGKLKTLGGRGLASKVRAGNDSKAQYILAASGVPLGATLKDLNEFSNQAGQPQAPVQRDNFIDNDAWFEQLNAKSTLELINETVEETKRDFDIWLDSQVNINYDDQMRRIHKHFNIPMTKNMEDADKADTTTGGLGRGAFGRSSRRGAPTDKLNGSGSFRGSGMAKSVLGNSKARGIAHSSVFSDVADKQPASGIQSAQENPFLRTKQEKYISKIFDLNAARNSGDLFPVVSEFGRVEAEAGNDVPKHLSEAFLALKHIAKENENARKPGDEGAVKERQYAKGYLEHDSNSVTSVNLRKQIINGSREYLESNFWAGLEEFIAKYPREANLGGTPSKINKVRAYVRIRVTRKDLGVDTAELKMLGDDYLWVLIFYLLRAGLVKEALQYVRDNTRAIRSMEHSSFPDWFANFANSSDRRIPRQAAQEMNARYASAMKFGADNAIDPYRQAVYKIIARCDLQRKSVEGISASMEDWLWVLFSLAREVNKAEEIAGEVFGLEDLRKIIEDIGQRHFVQSEESGTSYATYFLLLILSGMFERAVAWLYPYNYVSAVHVAIALDYYGFLRIADFSVAESELLTYNFRGEAQISFARLIGYYTRDFRLSRADAAIDYLTLLCLNADLPGETGRSQVSVCHEALKELVLETREFALLLGDISNNGDRVTGVIEDRMKLLKLQNDRDFLKRLTVQAAAVADDAGRTTDAVLLYHLAEEYDNVITICNRALSEAISIQIGQEQMRLQPLKPRVAEDQQVSNNPQSPSKEHVAPLSTLSLTSVDDPATLARNMMNLYSQNQAQYAKVREVNREACARLLGMHAIKAAVAHGNWPESLDLIEQLDLLPMRASGDVGVIRAYSQNFSLLPTSVTRNMGHLLLWTVETCGKLREQVMSSQFVKGRNIAEELRQKARDLMVFGGLVRYKMPSEVFEALARAGQA